MPTLIINQMNKFNTQLFIKQILYLLNSDININAGTKKHHRSTIVFYL